MITAIAPDLLDMPYFDYTDRSRDAELMEKLLTLRDVRFNQFPICLATEYLEILNKFKQPCDAWYDYLVRLVREQEEYEQRLVYGKAERRGDYKEFTRAVNEYKRRTDILLHETGKCSLDHVFLLALYDYFDVTDVEFSWVKRYRGEGSEQLHQMRPFDLAVMFFTLFEQTRQEVAADSVN